jgi:hypothetical protein
MFSPCSRVQNKEDFGVVREDVDFDEEEEGEETAMDSEVRANMGDAGAAVDSDFLEPRQIDAYWLQRRLGTYSADAIETQRLADEVLGALKVCCISCLMPPLPQVSTCCSHSLVTFDNVTYFCLPAYPQLSIQSFFRIPYMPFLTAKDAKDDRDCENKLVGVLGFDKFDLIRQLRKHRNMVLYCTLLAKAQTPAETEAIETKMRTDMELGSILKRLREVGIPSLLTPRPRPHSFLRPLSSLALSFADGRVRITVTTNGPRGLPRDRAASTQTSTWPTPTRPAAPSRCRSVLDGFMSFLCPVPQLV